MSWKINYFQTARGDSPVTDFIEKQDLAVYSKIIRYIDLLENNGPFLKPPYAKKIVSQLYELRVEGRIAIRIFYTIHSNEYYLLHAFQKKTQKTPSKEIKIALARLGEL